MARAQPRTAVPGSAAGECVNLRTRPGGAYLPRWPPLGHATGQDGGKGPVQNWDPTPTIEGKGMRTAILVATAGVLVAAGAAIVPAVTATASTTGLTGVVSE